MGSLRRITFFFFCFLVLGSDLFSQTVYRTKTGKKYHSESCRYLSKSKIAIPLEDALNQNYTPCKICSPPVALSSNSKIKLKSSVLTNKNENISNRCIAITKKGTRCKRMAQAGSQYCWQHQNNSSITQSYSNYSGDRTVYTGPRGGRYYYNSKGYKVYLKKK